MKFRKKPVVIDAIQWTGTNSDEIFVFLAGHIKGKVRLGKPIIIPTLEGNYKAIKGDWIIKGIKGEFYPCKPDIFKQIYELVRGDNAT